MASSLESETAGQAGRGKAIDAAVLVRRLVNEVMVGGDFEVLSELVVPAEVEPMRRWIEPFRRSFPDIHMQILTVVVEGRERRRPFPLLGHTPRSVARA